ncbi:hypothetical protein [Thermaerobacter litoralis]
MKGRVTRRPVAARDWREGRDRPDAGGGGNVLYRLAAALAGVLAAVTVIVNAQISWPM